MYPPIKRLKLTEQMESNESLELTEQIESNEPLESTEQLNPSEQLKFTHIDDLPPEMISELFEYLSLKDLAACSLVNKCWYSVYAAFKVHSLAAIDNADEQWCCGHHIRWHHPNQKFREEQQCPTPMFRFLMEKPMFSNLKKLALGVGSKFTFDLNQLNRFQQLVHLEMSINDFHEIRVHLNLPKLKVLAFHRGNYYYALSLDCPLLSTLLYVVEREYVNLLQVKNPETIRKLETDMVDPEWLARFKNVECLVTRKFEAISKATLLSLPKLNELHLNKDIEQVFSIEAPNGIGAADRLKRTLRKFLDEAKKLRGGDFRFRFSGLQLANVNVDQIDFGVRVNEEFRTESLHNEYVYMKYYHLIEPGAIDFVHNVHYTLLLYHLHCHRLLSGVTGEFPRCFSQKFTDIEHVRATGEVADVDHFLSFLKSLRSLRGLVLEQTGLGQAFYNQLPALTNPLRKLFLMDGHCEKGLDLNFEFLCKFSHLSMLNINPFLSLESLLSFARCLGRLEECGFGVRLMEQHFRVRKEKASARWRVEDADEVYLMKVAESKNPDEIVNFFKGLLDEMPERSF